MFTDQLIRLKTVESTLTKLWRVATELRISFSGCHLKFPVLNPFYYPAKTTIAVQKAAADAETPQSVVQMRESLRRYGGQWVPVERQ